MTANVELTDTFGGFRTKTNELVAMTHDGMTNFIKILDTTDSTSNITGSIVTAGGIGVAGSGTIGGNFNVHGNLHANGTISADGSLTFGDAATDNVVFAADVNSHIIPNTDDTYDLGSSGQKWKDIYINGVSYLDAINLNGTAISASATELNLLDGVAGLVQGDFTKLAAVDASATELDYNNITTLGTAEVSKTVTSDAAGNVTFVNGTNDIDIASHDGTNGLKLGGVLITTTAADLNSSATTGKSIAMAIVFGG